MPTIDSANIIIDLIKNNGHYFSDPQVHSIWSYVNSWGKETQAIFYNARHDMSESPFVQNPKILWNRKYGISEAGRNWLSEKEKENV